MHSRSNHYEVVIVGAGHNALVSAAYLAKAGLSVLVLERLKRTGGAAVSAKPFTGQPVRLSRYSYLISLLPQALIADLDLNLDLASRQTASYTPWSRNGEHGGLLVERPEGKKTRKSFRKLTGSDDEYAAWRTFYQEVGELAQLLAPTLMAPLPREQELRSQIEQGVWDDFIANPLGMTLQRRFRDDLVRGVVATDALIGTFASLNDPSLIQNRCFLYHLIGNGTGEWRVPIGGMGALSDALTKAATRGGAEILTNAEVNAIRTGPDGAEVTWSDGSREHSVTASTVLAGVAPWVLTALLGEVSPAQTKPAGSQLKINLLLDRLPRLKSGADPAVAFGGTLHLAEGYTQLQTAYDAAAAGRIPDPMPGEIYCHSLTDDSILRKRAGSAHTLTYFGLHPQSAEHQNRHPLKGSKIARCKRERKGEADRGEQEARRGQSDFDPKRAQSQRHGEEIRDPDERCEADDAGEHRGNGEKPQADGSVLDERRRSLPQAKGQPARTGDE